MRGGASRHLGAFSSRAGWGLLPPSVLDCLAFLPCPLIEPFHLSLSHASCHCPTSLKCSRAVPLATCSALPALVLEISAPLPRHEILSPRHGSALRFILCSHYSGLALPTVPLHHSVQLEINIRPHSLDVPPSLDWTVTKAPPSGSVTSWWSDHVKKHRKSPHGLLVPGPEHEQQPRESCLTTAQQFPTPTFPGGHVACSDFCISQESLVANNRSWLWKT